MTRFAPEWEEHQHRRWLRHDAHRFVRPGYEHLLAPAGAERKSNFAQPHLCARERLAMAAREAEAEARAEAEFKSGLRRLRIEMAELRFALAMRRLALRARKYSPDQPRVPAGNPDGGQWTRDGGNAIDEQTIDISAQRRSRSGGSGGIRINGQSVEATPAQEARFAVANARAQDALNRVRELDPKWQPVPSFYDTNAESAIAKADAEALEAQARIAELSRIGIGPGPFAGESLPARGQGRDFTIGERREGNRIGSETGCHTCGTKEPGTPSGNFVLDHQLPSAWNAFGKPQRLYPQCLACSSRQGNWISRNGGRR